MDRDISPIDVKRMRRGQWLRWLVPLMAFVGLLLALRWVIAPGVARDEIRTARVERGEVVASISATGQVVPRNEQVISVPFASDIQDVALRAGAAVERGDVIIRLEKRALESTVRDLQEQLALKEVLRKSTRLGLEKNLNEQRSRLDLLAIDLESRKARHARLDALVKKGAISTGELQEAALDVRRTEVEIQQLDRAMDNQRASAGAELERIDLESSILGNQLAEQQRLLETATVRAPRDGVLTWVLDQPGAAVSPGLPLARVADLSEYRVEAQVSDFYAPRLAEGLNAQVNAGGTPMRATVTGILPTVEGGTMTLLLDLEDPRASVLRPQLRVDVDVITGQASDALSVRNGPAVGESGRQFLYRIVDGEAVRTSVELGFASRQRVQVLGGLDEGDEIIISDIRDYQHLERFDVE